MQKNNNEEPDLQAHNVTCCELVDRPFSQNNALHDVKSARQAVCLVQQCLKVQNSYLKQTFCQFKVLCLRPDGIMYVMDDQNDQTLLNSGSKN